MFTRLHVRIVSLFALAMVLAMLAACGGSEPTPTPTKTPATASRATSTPAGLATLDAPITPIQNPQDVAERASATPFRRATSTPTARPTRTATRTPTAVQQTPTPTTKPTATPTPTATPFPPGPPSKLGLFMGRNDPQIFELLSTGNVALVKTLEYDPNFVAEIKKISPETFVVARYSPLPVPDLNDWDPIAAAHEFVNLLLPIATEPQRLANIDCWEAFNEPVASNAEQMASLAVFEAERTRLLAEAGVRSCIGNFSTGHPSLELWPAFYPALEAAKQYGGYLALHEYSAPYMWFGSGANQLQEGADEGDEGWLTLRYRKAYRDYLQPAGLDIPLVITETGIDGQVGGRPGPKGLGWQDFTSYWREQGQVSTTDWGFYVEQLAWYDGELAKDDYVIGAAIFALAGPTGWESFEIGGDPIEILKQYFSVHPPR